MAAIKERALYLTLTSVTSGLKLVFFVPETFGDRYTNTLTPIAGEHRTHASQHLWEKGEVGDLELSLYLVAGVSYKIETPDKLRRVLEQLTSMALPPSPNSPWVEAVQVTISGQSTWFRRNYFIKEVRPEWSGPWDLVSGLSMTAKVAVTLTPTFSARYSVEPALPQALPRRPFTFRQA